MPQTKENIAQLLKKYLPDYTISYVVDLMFSERLSFKITPPRKTKQGDYRFPRNGKPHQITVNGNLNPYAFLITTLHEFAHMNTYIHYGNKVKAHGEEWKMEFQELLLPVLQQKKLPKDIESALVYSLTNLKASSCTDVNLYRTLKKYDKIQDTGVLLEELKFNDLFRLHRKLYRLGKLRRTRFICTEVKTGKEYLVSRIAEVEKVE